MVIGYHSKKSGKSSDSKLTMPFRTLLLLLVLSVTGSTYAQEYHEAPPLTLRPLLQQLGTELMQGKTGSIVAVDPATGEVLCMVTN